MVTAARSVKFDEREVAMVMHENPGDDAMREMFGPGQVDQQLRGTVSSCWMALPKERRTVEEVEREMRRLFERAMKDLREDGKSFGIGG